MERYIEKQLSNQSSLLSDSTSGDSVSSNFTEPNEINYEYDNDSHSRCEFNYEEMEKERNRVQVEKVDLAFELSKKNKIIEATLQDNLKKENENICLKKANDELKTTNAELFKKVSDFTLQLESEQKKKNSLLNLLAEMKEDYNKEMDRFLKIKDDIEKDNELSKSKFVQKENEFAKLKSDYFELSNNLHESISEKERLNDEVKKLEMELNQVRTNNKEQKLNIDKLELELQALKANWNNVARFFAPNDTNLSNQTFGNPETVEVTTTTPLFSELKSTVNITNDSDVESHSSLIFETTNVEKTIENEEASSHVSSLKDFEQLHESGSLIDDSEAEEPYIPEEHFDVSISADDDSQNGVNSKRYDLRKKRLFTDDGSLAPPQAKRPSRIKNEFDSEKDDKSDGTVEEEEEIDSKNISLTTTQTPQTNSKKSPCGIHKYYKFELRHNIKHPKVVVFASCGKCYIFNHSQDRPESTMYRCNSCRCLNYSLTGCFEKDVDGREYFCIKKAHICEPVPYESLKR